MSEAKVLANPVVTVGAVALTGWCTRASVIHGFDVKSDNAFGDTSRKSRAGVANNKATLTIYMSYATAASYATLKGLVGTQVLLKVLAAPGAESATNPGFVLTDTFLAELPVMDAEFGELISVDINFDGGDYSEDITP